MSLTYLGHVNCYMHNEYLLGATFVKHERIPELKEAADIAGRYLVSVPRVMLPLARIFEISGETRLNRQMIGHWTASGFQWSEFRPVPDVIVATQRMLDRTNADT